ncbi:SDR family NAD(P)-dependent oxidoreductase [Streptomyces cynarae]|uniref:SDR family NAD(P)-dependent oxidoreductase n=1 Tax=Streptomyces cynarae TaxID=2981134 RepID=UPI00406C15B0
MNDDRHGQQHRTPISRIVAVTGADTGIGRATARAFAAEGAHVLAAGRRAEPLDEMPLDTATSPRWLSTSPPPAAPS